MAEPTLFERILSGEIPSHKIGEGEGWYAFLDIFPRREGHTLVIPTTPGVAPRCDADETTLANDRNALLALTAIAGLAGLPQLHLPLFTLHNAPCGLSLVGKKGNDLALLALAKTLTTG